MEEKNSKIELKLWNKVNQLRRMKNIPCQN